MLQTKTEGTISSADWKLDSEELQAVFNSNTKAIIFNNPNNPLGKVFTRAEIRELCSLCCQHDVLMISDDVYEHMVYDRQTVKFWLLLKESAFVFRMMGKKNNN